MIKSEYLQAINSELDNYHYRTRFLEELSDHYDDESYNLTVSGNNQADQKTQDNLGPPSLLAKNFNENMEKIYKMHWLRSLIITAIAINLFYILTSLITNALFENIANIDIQFFSQTLSLIVQTLQLVIIQALIVGSFYYLCLKNIRLPKATNKKKIFVSIAMLFVPIAKSLLVLYFLCFDIIWILIIQQDFSNWADMLVPQIIGLAKDIAVIWVGWQILRGAFTKPIANMPSNSKMKTAFKITASLIAICLIILPPFLQPYIPDRLNNLIMLSMLLNFLIMIFSGIVVSNIFNVLITQYFVIALYISIGLICIWQIIRYIQFKIKKDKLLTFPWFAAIIFSYCLNTLVIMPMQGGKAQDGYNQIAWQIPAIDISEKIEQSQFGFFYSFVHYFNQDEGQAFHYNIEQSKDKNTFYINQNSGKQFVIGDIKTIDTFSKTTVKKKDNKHLGWTSAFTGFKNNDVKCLFPETADLPQNWEETPRQCKEVYYKDTLLYKTVDGWPNLNNILVSADEKWALLHFSHGAYDPSAVYLVQLQ